MAEETKKSPNPFKTKMELEKARARGDVTDEQYEKYAVDFQA